MGEGFGFEEDLEEGLEERVVIPRPSCLGVGGCGDRGGSSKVLEGWYRCGDVGRAPGKAPGMSLRDRCRGTGVLGTGWVVGRGGDIGSRARLP